MDRFSLRRAVERLRDGLFDRCAVNFLTVGEDRIEPVFFQGLQALDKGQANHLCLCGSYGQGKSHTLTYLHQLALSQGYATSVVSLDRREIPFHQFSSVYHSMMKKLSLPEGKDFASEWKKFAEKGSFECLDTMPHRFRMILMAMLSKNKQSSHKKTPLKKEQIYRPQEYGHWLERALMGYDIPVSHLKEIFKCRDVERAPRLSLACRGSDPYFQMTQSLGRLLKLMGYKGLLLFFDEAESITQGRLNQRVKSYYLLDQFFQTQDAVFPLFAFTDDFFEIVNSELYETQEVFPKNYADCWRDVNVFRLSDISSHGWETLLDRLMQMYAQAYQIEFLPLVKPRLRSYLGGIGAQETRFKLKALVNRLDIETQQILLDS